MRWSRRRESVRFLGSRRPTSAVSEHTVSNPHAPLSARGVSLEIRTRVHDVSKSMGVSNPHAPHFYHRLKFNPFNSHRVSNLSSYLLNGIFWINFPRGWFLTTTRLLTTKAIIQPVIISNGILENQRFSCEECKKKRNKATLFRNDCDVNNDTKQMIPGTNLFVQG